jgi:3-oxoacyl-[acyl-carrier protein] reductase
VRALEVPVRRMLPGDADGAVQLDHLRGRPGQHVGAVDLHARRLAATRDELAEAYAGLVWAQSCDVTDSEQVAALIEGAAGHFGRIDVLINNAGLGGTSSVLDMTDEQWQRVLDVTLNGTFRCTRAALRQMVAQGHGGAVVNNASVLGWRAQPGQAHYAAAKAGVMAFTRCAALDVAEHGIRVNAVAPSLAIHPFLAKVTSEDLLAELAGREAFGRAAQPWEVANVMVFLASVLPTGWPRAIAPPLTLTRSGSHLCTASQDSTTDANASLISNRSMSPTVMPLRASTRSVAWTGPSRW